MEKILFKISALLLVGMLLFSSCSKSVTDNKVYVDSYINAIYNRAGVPVFSMMHTAYSFTKLTSVTVQGSGSPVTLIDPTGLGLSFYSNPADTASYTTTVPSPASFVYNIVYGTGTPATFADAVPANTLLPVQQLLASKTATDISLTWKALSNAQAYKVRIFDVEPSSTTIIYESDFMTPKDATSDLSIQYSLTNFTLYSLTNIRFEVSAFIFEQDQTTFDAVSVATTKTIAGM